VTTAEASLLLDTSAVLHVIRGNEVGRRIDAALGLRSRAERPLISVITLGEAHAFADYRGWGGERVRRLDALLRELVVVDISSASVLRRYAEIHTFAVRNGRTLADNDVWIAATAAAAGAVLVTTDGDFDPLDPVFLRRRLFPVQAPSPGS
jgi:tRNA(fMet)-specific endonuclease VapC